MSTAADPTARAAAAYLMWLRPRFGYRSVHALLYLASMQHYRDHGEPLFEELFYAAAWGPCVRSVTLDWFRWERRRQRREPQRLRALARRVRTWTIREAQRRGGPGRVMRLNVPGGWSEADGRVQRLGVAFGLAAVRSRVP